jgi:hypothetical protein
MWILDFSSDFDDFISLATLLQMLLANGPSNSTKGEGRQKEFNSEPNCPPSLNSQQLSLEINCTILLMSNYITKFMHIEIVKP